MEGQYEDNRVNLNGIEMRCINASVNNLILTVALWLLGKTPCFQEIHIKVLGSDGALSQQFSLK